MKLRTKLAIVWTGMFTPSTPGISSGIYYSTNKNLNSMPSDQTWREIGEWEEAWQRMNFVDKYNPVSTGVESSFL